MRGRKHAGRILGSRLATGVATSAATLLVVGGTAVAMSGSSFHAGRIAAAPAQARVKAATTRHVTHVRVAATHAPTGRVAPVRARRPAARANTGFSTQILGGSVSFVDAADSAAFIGPGGNGRVRLIQGAVAWTIPIGGTLTSLNARTEPLAGGSVTFTVIKSAVPTAMSCTIVAPAVKCPVAPGPITFVTGDGLAIRIDNATGGPLRGVRWTAVYTIPD